MAEKIIIDTDIGEDIDDILACAFALRSPEFEVLAITTVDGDTRARSRIARRLTRACGRPEVPVAAGYVLNMPQPDPPTVVPDSVTQFDVAPDEKGLPAAAALGAGELVADLAGRHPGEISLLTIGSMANVGQALVRFPEAMGRLKQIVTNGGSFGPDRPTSIGWNLRYDPVAAALAARAPVPWVLLPENATAGPMGLRAGDVGRLQGAGGDLPRLLSRAIELWRRNKRECRPDTLPHASDFNVFAYLLGHVPTRRGRVFVTVPPRGRTAELRIEDDPEGPHLLGSPIGAERGAELRELFLERVLAG